MGRRNLFAGVCVALSPIPFPDGLYKSIHVLSWALFAPVATLMPSQKSDLPRVSATEWPKSRHLPPVAAVERPKSLHYRLSAAATPTKSLHLPRVGAATPTKSLRLPRVGAATPTKSLHLGHSVADTRTKSLYRVLSSKVEGIIWSLFALVAAGQRPFFLLDT